MNELVTILIAMLAVYGFYSALLEIRGLMRKYCRKKNNCTRNVPPPFDNDR